jgi:hypothetical protein
MTIGGERLNSRVILGLYGYPHNIDNGKVVPDTSVDRRIVWQYVIEPNGSMHVLPDKWR